MMVEFTLWDIVRNLLLAARWTVVLSLVAFVGGGIVGLLILLLRISANNALRRFASGYIGLFQGTPLLMQLFLVFFGLSLVGLNVPPWLAAGTALIVWTSAFLSEIWRGCVEAIPRGQWDASGSLGLGFFAQLRYVILPQALIIAVPPTVGFLVQLVKSTALASIVGFNELTRAGQIVANATFQPFPIYALVALLYFAMCYPLTLSARMLERRLARSRA